MAEKHECESQPNDLSIYDQKQAKVKKNSLTIDQVFTGVFIFLVNRLHRFIFCHSQKSDQTFLFPQTSISYDIC